MGVETVLDVEESTEPPICGYKDPSPKPNVTSQSDSQPCDTEEKSISHTSDRSVRANPPNKEIPDDNAHLIEPSELASVLQTDLRYVQSQNIFLIPGGIKPNTIISNGLSGTEAALRLERDGPNTVREMEGVSVWGVLLRQVSNSLTLVSPQSLRLPIPAHQHQGPSHNNGPLFRN
jgi:Na+-exporting ATPase